MQELLFSSGILRYSQEEGQHRLVVEVDPELARYYRSLIPKHIDTNKPRWDAHISVIRKEKIPITECWERHEGKEVIFQYSPIIHFSEVYCWLNVFCKRLEEIRLELGLPVSSIYTKPPSGYLRCFHTTLGNFK